MAALELLEDSIARFERFTSNPEKYLGVQDDILQPVKTLTKSIYDYTKKEERKLAKENALPNLIVDNFDEEQIWQEIELQNEDRWTHLLENVSKFLNKPNDLVIPVTIRNPDDHMSEDDDVENSDLDENEVKSETKKNSKSLGSMISDDIKANGTSKKALKMKKKPKGSIVDDEFFELKQMEEFLDAQDKLEMKKDKKSKKKIKKDDGSDSDEEEEIDLFENWESDENNDEDMDSEKNPKYNDFYDKSDSDESVEQSNKSKRKFQEIDDDEDIDEEEMESDDDEIDLKDNNANNKKKVRFSEPQPSSSDDDDEDGDSNNEGDPTSKNNVDPTKLSEFQLRQQRLSKKIGHLENSLLEEKAWPMKGEVDAAGRPQNSLLEEVVDFDITSRPAPVITEETTLKLQDIIIQRIKDKSWDDVERKMKPVQDVPEFKKQLVLDQEKSKLSLAQVYEQDYIKQRDALDPDADEKPEEEPPEHVEIRKGLTSLFAKLDALCNFHYTPKVSAPEVKIISNIPAINMEEVAPVATADATLLAPEEIKSKPKGDIIGKSERTDTDKKRERRQKKLRQREKEKEKQKRSKLIEKLNPGLGNKYSKEKVSKLLEKVTKDRNVDKMTMTQDKKSYTSSTAFFTQLQDEVSNTIKTTLQKSKAKENKSASAKRFKL